MVATCHKNTDNIKTLPFQQQRAYGTVYASADSTNHSSNNFDSFKIVDLQIQLLVFFLKKSNRNCQTNNSQNNY